MYDIKPLEEEWEKYNKKKRKPIYLSVLFFLLLLIAFAVMQYKNISLLKIFSVDKNESMVTSVIKSSDVLINKPIKTLEVKKDVLSSVTNSISEVKPGVIVTSDNNPMEPTDVFVDENNNHKIQVHAKPKIKTIKKEKRKKVKLNIVITDASSLSAYKEVERRFKVSPNPDDSLFLARGYFKKAKYRKSAHWALQTNKLNGDIEESWLIFARSKARTGQKNEAIRVLKEYVKRSHSTKANKLLNKLIK